MRKKVKIEKNWYSQNLQKVIDFVGKPSGNIIRDNLPLLVAIIYISCGIFNELFPDIFVFKMMRGGISEGNIILTGSFIIAGSFLAFYWLLLINKICWGKQGKEVTAKKCWWWLKLLFVLFLPFIWVKKLILYILREARQEIISQQVVYVLLSFVLTLMILFPLELQGIKALVKVVYIVSGRVFTDELIVLVIVIVLIATFFFVCKNCIHLSIRWLEIAPQRRKLKKAIKENGEDSVKDEAERIEREYAELIEKADEELGYSKLYFYVIMNIILLSLHFDEADIYGKLFADEFIGVTALAALFREVGEKMRE